MNPNEPKIDQPRAPVVAHQHVARLDVTVDQAGLVHRDQPAPDGDPLAQNRLVVRPRGLGQPIAHRGSGHVLHRDPHAVIGEPRFEHRNHVGMRELGQASGFSQRSLAQARIEPGRIDELDRDRTLELRIPGAVDHAHATVTDALVQLDPTKTRGVDLLTEE
jgi:hypothetical protein